MNQSQSSAPLRFLLLESVEDLVQQPAGILPDGALAYVSSNQCTYRLYIALGNSLDSLEEIVVTPAAVGTSARWIKQDDRGSSPWSCTELLSAPTTVSPLGQFIWTALGATAGSYILEQGNENAFVVSPSTSLLTYHGITQRFVVESRASVSNATNGDAIEVHSAISINGDVPSGGPSDARLFGEQSVGVSSVIGAVLSSRRSVVLHDGHTVRVMFRNMSGSQNIGIQFFDLSLLPG